MTEGTPLRDLLPAEMDALGDTIEGDLRKHSNTRGSGLFWGFIRDRAAREVCDTLDLDVWQVLAHSWAKASELRTLGKDTSGQTTIAHLGKHDFKTAVYPVLTVDLGTPPYPELRFTLELAAHFEGAALSIRNGHIVAVETGNASVYAELKYGKARLHKRDSPKVKIAGRREFKEPGIRIG